MIIRGDSFSLPLAENSIDAVVCDPPYALKYNGGTMAFDLQPVPPEASESDPRQQSILDVIGDND